MKSSLRIFALSLLFALSLQSVHAAGMPLRIPALDGEFSGVMKLIATPGAVDSHAILLNWKLNASSPEDMPGKRVATLQATGTGIEILIRAEIDATTGDGTWQSETAHADLAVLLPRIADLLPAAIANLNAEGALDISARGTVTKGAIDGNALVEISNATITNEEKAWVMEGLSLHAKFASLANFTTETDTQQTLSFSKLSIAGLEVLDARAAFSLTPGGLLSLDSFQAQTLGGTITADPAKIDLSHMATAIRARVVDIDSAALAPYLPGAIAEAHGRLSGDLEFRWNPESGLSFGDGHLALQKTDPASFRLTPSPGFFTANVPEKIDLMGGFLRRFFSVNNPVHETLKKIELGQMPLTVESISVDFVPAGDENGNTARIAVVALPTDPNSAVKLVRFKIGVSGPLTEVIRFSMDDTLSFSW